jgi:purine-binding chemotaxis protein CheW
MNNLFQEEDNNEELLQLVSFRIGTEEFGANILKVQEIIRYVAITKVPSAPDFVEGVINLRGKVIPVVNLRIKLGMGKKDYDNATRIIVIEINNKIIGFMVDSVSEVLRIPKNIIETPPTMVSDINSEYITAVGKLADRLLILLDMEKIFSAEDRLHAIAN